MSNRITIQGTEFNNYPNTGKTKGVRVYDNEGQAYDNTWESIPDNDMQVLALVLESDDPFISGLMDYVEENKTGLEINGTWYDWEEIKPVFEKT